MHIIIYFTICIQGHYIVLKGEVSGGFVKYKKTVEKYDMTQ